MAKRLYRSQKTKVIGGVAGGLADYLNIDHVLIRVLFVITSLFSGMGFLLYIILWIVVPQEPLTINSDVPYENENLGFENEESSNSSRTTVSETGGSGRVVTGLILIGIGIIFLIDRYIPHFDFSDILPIIIIIVGIALIINSVKTNK